MYKLILLVHIAGGLTALVAAAGALATTKGDRRHVYSGRTFVLGMLIVFLTAVPMTLIRPNLFLFLIAVFSFYLALTGWLRARNRSGVPVLADWVAATAMAATSLAMFVRAIALMGAQDSRAVVLLSFGGIGGVFAIADLYFLRGHRYQGEVRIAAHLTRMLAGTIAAVTAFTVVNLRFEPAFVVWLAPTLVLTPVIVYWNVRVRRPAGSDSGLVLREKTGAA
jgi:hypothetical protein